MAIDMQAQRAEGVSPLSGDIARGSVGKNDNGSAAGSDPNLPTTSLDEERMGSAPGGHVNRGVEPNTALCGPGNTSDPMIDTVVAGERPVMSEPFAVPSALGDVAGPGDPSWGGADSAERNTRPLDIPHDSFSAVGESPYTIGQPDGRT